MRDFVLLYINGRRFEVRGRAAFGSLSDFLRNDLGLTGTKIVCAEGDCGSCSVLLGRQRVGDIQYRAVCSCIQFVYQLDCTHIITIEGLKYDGKLNPVQEALVQWQGTQCGFCTPGFVVSICAMFESRESADPEDVRAACIGNLCRCTGYDAILKAGASVDGTSMQPLSALFPATQMLADFADLENESVRVQHDDRQFLKPNCVTDACEFKASHPDCIIIAGGTDIGVTINKGLRDPKTILVTSGLHDIQGVALVDGSIVAGAGASLTDLERVCKTDLPEYAKMLYWFGSPPIRNAGTIGGNIANGSPIGDSLPALFVLNAEVELNGVAGVRRVNINDFYTGYRKSVMRSDELITRIHIPLPAVDDVFRLYKVSRRKDLDISAFTAAIWMKLPGQVVTQARIAIGGVAPVVMRVPRTESFLIGRSLDGDTLEEAGLIARKEVMPITDVRGTADYRLQLTENIFAKLSADLNTAQPAMY